MDYERTADLLEDLLESDSTEITAEMVEEVGGADAVIDMALE